MFNFLTISLLNYSFILKHWRNSQKIILAECKTLLKPLVSPISAIGATPGARTARHYDKDYVCMYIHCTNILRNACKEHVGLRRREIEDLGNLISCRCRRAVVLDKPFLWLLPHKAMAIMLLSLSE